MSAVHPFERVAAPDDRDSPTTPLTPVDGASALDAFALLDHRARRRAIPSGLAPSGHYLAFEQEGRTHLVRLEGRLTHVGRSHACELRFEDRRVSRDHAIFARSGRHVRILDNRSMNGTFVNDQPIVSTNLRHGDAIRIGPVAMRYVVVS